MVYDYCEATLRVSLHCHYQTVLPGWKVWNLHDEGKIGGDGEMLLGFILHKL